jgi:hypothetical protein
MTRQTKVTDTMLDDAYIIMAGIIRNHGEKYLPIFKRLHEERLQRKADSDLKKIALQIADKKTY